jgi:hypothetical protein
VGGGGEGLGSLFSIVSSPTKKQLDSKQKYGVQKYSTKKAEKNMAKNKEIYNYAC